MVIRVEIDSAELAQILSDAWGERDNFTKPEHKHQRVRHLLRMKVKERIEKALDDAAYEVANGKL